MTVGNGNGNVIMSPNAKRAREANAALADRYVNRDGSPVTPEQVKDVVTEAATKPKEAYELERAALAGSLGVRREVLDELVDEARAEAADAVVESAALPDMVLDDPWQEPVPGVELLDEIYANIQRHVIMEPSAALTCALWTLFAHSHDAYQHSPILLVHSPEPECGKTTLLDVLRAMVPKPLMLVSMTGATLFRLTDKFAPTLLMDEHDALNRERREAMRDILDSSHRKGAKVPRVTSGGRGEVKLFDVWCPKAIARIGLEDVHSTVLSRSLKIPLTRALPEDKRERVPKDLRERLEGLRQRATRWAADNITSLASASPDMPHGLGDRVCDNWHPLLAIADLCGAGDLARSAALKLSARESYGVGPALLSDIRDLFDESGADEVASTDIVEWLIKRSEHPWAEWLKHGRNREQAVAATLSRYSIRPVKITGKSLGGFLFGYDLPAKHRPQGYRRRDFDSAWAAFVQPRQPRHSRREKENVSKVSKLKRRRRRKQ